MHQPSTSTSASTNTNMNENESEMVETVRLIEECNEIMDKGFVDLAKRLVSKHFEEARMEGLSHEKVTEKVQEELKKDEVLLSAIKSSALLEWILGRLGLEIDEQMMQWQQRRQSYYADRAIGQLNADPLPDNSWAFKHKGAWYRATEDQFVSLGYMLERKATTDDISVVDDWFERGYFVRFPRDWHP